MPIFVLFVVKLGTRVTSCMLKSSSTDRRMGKLWCFEGVVCPFDSYSNFTLSEATSLLNLNRHYDRIIKYFGHKLQSDLYAKESSKGGFQVSALHLKTLRTQFK